MGEEEAAVTACCLGYVYNTCDTNQQHVRATHLTKRHRFSGFGMWGGILVCEMCTVTKRYLGVTGKFKCTPSNCTDLLAAYRLSLASGSTKCSKQPASGSTKCSQQPTSGSTKCSQQTATGLYWITGILSTLRSSFVKIHIDITQPSTPRFTKSSLPRSFPPKILYTLFISPMPREVHSPFTWWSS